MDHMSGFNTYTNGNLISHHQTMPPFRGTDKDFIMRKYFQSLQRDVERANTEGANYANARVELEEANTLHQSRGAHLRHSHHHHFHSRSQSHTLRHINDLNNYYNIESNMGTTIIPARTIHPSPVNDVPVIHNRLAPLGLVETLHVCNEIGNLDSPPAMPSSRKYSISGSKNQLFKIPFPQQRVMKKQYTDPKAKISLPPGTSVTVLGPSNEDRSKFTVCVPCVNNLDIHPEHIDVPHQFTYRP